MTPSLSLDERIAALVTDVDETLRAELAASLRTLRDAENVPGAIVGVSRLVEGPRGLLGHIAAAGRHQLRGGILQAQIVELEAAGLLPGQLASGLHWIRVHANKARHFSEKAKLEVADAETALGFALRLLEWFHREYEHGPRLATIYAGAARPLTLQDRFAELQRASGEQVRVLQMELARMHEEFRRRSEQAETSSRDPIPIPLPALRGTFVGRERERDTMRHLLRQRDTRLLVVVAPGGHGKTELVTKLLQEAAPDGVLADPSVQGILYLRCVRGELDLGRVFAAAGRIVGQSERFQQVYGHGDAPLERKLEVFFQELSKAGTVWIVLDNFEDLLRADDTFADPDLQRFLEVALVLDHSVRLLLTTRAVPRFAGSHRMRLLDLHEGLPAEDAVLYLRTEGAAYGLTEAPKELLLTFVRRVHCVPKALESIIGYLADRYPIVQLGDLLTQEDLFADFDRYDAENGLKGLIAEQFADQTADAQLALCALAVFSRPMPVGALRFLLPALDWAKVLPRLERNKLASRQDDRYDLHPLVREHAYRQIPGGEEGAFTRRGMHLRAAEFFRQLRKPSEEWKTMTDVLPNLQEFHHLIQAERFDDAEQVISEVGSGYLDAWGHSARGVELRTQLVGRLSGPEREARNWRELGAFHVDLGAPEKALACLERSQALAPGAGDRREERARLNNLGGACAMLGDYPRAIRHHEEALAIAHEIGDRRGAAVQLVSLGFTLRSVGRVEEALGHLHGALAIWEEIGYRVPASCFNNLGECHHSVGELDKAMGYFEKALALARQQGYHLSLGIALGSIGEIYLTRGDLERALDYCRQALAIDREVGFRKTECDELYNLGRIHEDLGDLTQAAGYYQQSKALASEMGARPHLAQACCALGMVSHRQRELAEARRHYAEAVQHNAILTNHRVAVLLGVLCLEEGRSQEAADWFQRGLTDARLLLEKTPRLFAVLHCLALAQLGCGQKEEGLATYRLALGVCRERGAIRRATADVNLLRQALPTTATEEALLLLQRE